MQDYFGYDVFFVMNITDIDDKIIKRYHQSLPLLTDNLKLVNDQGPAEPPVPAILGSETEFR